MGGKETYWSSIATIVPVLALAMVIEIRLNFSRWARQTRPGIPWLAKALPTAIATVWICVALAVETGALEILHGDGVKGNLFLDATTFVSLGMSIAVLYPVYDIVFPFLGLAGLYTWGWLRIAILRLDARRLETMMRRAMHELAYVKCRLAFDGLAIARRSMEIARDWPDERDIPANIAARLSEVTKMHSTTAERAQEAERTFRRHERSIPRMARKRRAIKDSLDEMVRKFALEHQNAVGGMFDRPGEPTKRKRKRRRRMGRSED